LKNLSIREQLIENVGNLEEKAVSKLVLKRIELGEDPLFMPRRIKPGRRTIRAR